MLLPPSPLLLLTAAVLLRVFMYQNQALLCLQAALRAKASGSTRFCMGAAWRGPSQVGARQWQRVLDMVKRIRGLDMEVTRPSSCVAMRTRESTLQHC